MQTSKGIGDEKEREAVKALKKRGYKILETNFLIKGGEIDIIAKHKDTI
ncbi:MAG: YraN family protein, partial [Elusimicrobiota bacterium]|nr:YraN family protein [Elusimicrobiota bacterium]